MYWLGRMYWLWYVLELMLWVEELRWLGQLLLIRRLLFLWEMFGVVAGVDIPVKEQPVGVVLPHHLLEDRQSLHLMECQLALCLPVQFLPLYLVAVCQLLG